MKTVTITDRFGNTKSFQVKDRGVFRVEPGEEFITALVRHYYPSVYRQHQKMRKLKESTDDS